MSEFIDLSVDAAELENKLSVTAKSVNSIRRKFLSKIGLELKKEIRRQIQISYVSNNHTGQMAKGVIYKVSKNGNAYSFNNVEKLVVFPGRKVGAKTIAQNAGRKIFSKKTGKFHHEIKAKGFVQTAEQIYIDSGRYKQDVDRIVDAELRKVGLI